MSWSMYGKNQSDLFTENVKTEIIHKTDWMIKEELLCVIDSSKNADEQINAAKQLFILNLVSKMASERANQIGYGYASSYTYSDMGDLNNRLGLLKDSVRKKYFYRALRSLVDVFIKLKHSDKSRFKSFNIKTDWLNELVNEELLKLDSNLQKSGAS